MQVFKLQNEFTFSNRKVSYFTIIPDIDSIKIYYREGSHGLNFITKCIILKDNKIIKDEIILFDNSELNHNFTPFVYDNELYASGGLDFYATNGSIIKSLNYIEGMQIFYKDYIKPFLPECKYYHLRKKFVPDILPECNKGLYLYKFIKGNWEKVSLDPILSRISHNSFIKSPVWEIGNFDGKQSVLYFNDKLYVFCRANTGKGRRGIQVGICNDLNDINHMEFKLCEFGDNSDIEKDEYYICNMFKHPTKDLLIALLPYRDKSKNIGSLRLLKSTDGINWIICKDLFINSPTYLSKRKEYKDFIHPVQNYWINNNEFNILVQYNYLGLNAKEPVVLKHYKCTLGELNEMLSL
jgi:hypothetical protein